MSRAGLLALIFLFGCALATHQRAPSTPAVPAPDFALAAASSAPPLATPHGLPPTRALDAALWHLKYAQGLAAQRSLGGAP